VLSGGFELGISRAHFIQECGQLTSHVAITGTSQVGSAYSGQSTLRIAHFRSLNSCAGVVKLDPNLLKLPVVAETFDRMTHPLAPHPVTPADVREAFENMTDGKLREGNVGCVWRA
jgi:L-aminopeptidase/D-esterase-like protein